MATIRRNQIGNSAGVSQFSVEPYQFGPTMYFQSFPGGYEGQRLISATYNFYILSVTGSDGYGGIYIYSPYNSVLESAFKQGTVGWIKLRAVGNVVFTAENLIALINQGGRLFAIPGTYFSAYTEQSSNIPYIEILTEPASVSIVDQYPVAGTRTVRTLSNRFGWAITPTVDIKMIIGTVQQQRATFQWRVQGSSQIKSINVNVSGMTGYVDIPANTFTADNIEWRVTVTTNGGYTVTSGWTLINTADTLSSAVAVTPNAAVVEDETGVDFRWNHVISTGTAPTGFHIQISTDQGGTWETLTEQASGATTYHAPHNAVPSGAILWRVRTKNSTGTYGSWSAAVGAVVRVAPDVPSITYVDAKPRVTVRWQSVNQQAYQVQVLQEGMVVYDSGMRYGTDKELRTPAYLPDGLYTVQVRVQNASGLVSAYAVAATTIENRPGETFKASTRADHAAVYISWAPIAIAVRYYVLRDGIPIAMLASDADTAYTDYLCCGLHEYKVMAVDTDDYYTMSDPVAEKSLPLYALLVPVNTPERWILLKWSPDSTEKHQRTAGYSKEYVTYQGREKPVVYISSNKTVNNSFQYKFIDIDSVSPREARNRIEALDGATVLYKNRSGDRYFGTLDAISTTNGKDVDASFEIVETDYSEAVEYL